MVYRLNPQIHAQQGQAINNNYLAQGESQRADKRLALAAEGQQFQQGAAQIDRGDRKKQFEANLEMEGRRQKLQVEGEEYRQGKTDARADKSMNYQMAEGVRNRLHADKSQSRGHTMALDVNARQNEAADKRQESSWQEARSVNLTNHENELELNAQKNQAAFGQSIMKTASTALKAFIDGKVKSAGDMAAKTHEWKLGVLAEALGVLTDTKAAPKMVTNQAYLDMMKKTQEMSLIPIFTTEDMADPTFAMMGKASVDSGEAITVMQAAAVLEDYDENDEYDARNMSDQEVIKEYRALMTDLTTAYANKASYEVEESKFQKEGVMSMLRGVAGGDTEILGWLGSIDEGWSNHGPSAAGAEPLPAQQAQAPQQAYPPVPPPPPR